MSEMGPDCVKTPDPQLARRISIPISSISELIALAASFGRRQLRKQFCASVAEARFHTAGSEAKYSPGVDVFRSSAGSGH